METRFALGAAGGALTVREEGGRAVFEAVLPDDRRGLYKVWLTGRGGQFLLGTLMPENARLRLHRTLPVAELERHGVWPLTGAQARLAFPFGEGESTPPKGWRWEREPGRLLGDRLLRQSAVRLGRAALRREEDGFSLALPWRAGGEFPLTPLFCFARLERLDGGEWLVFSFNRRGCPMFPPGHKDGGGAAY